MNKQTFLLITLLGCVSSFAYGQNFLSTSKEIAKAALSNSTVKGSAELGKLGIQMIKGGVSGAVNQKALLDNLYRQDGFHGYFKPGALPRLDLTSSVHFHKTLEPVSALYSSPLASFAPVVKQKADDVLALWKEGTTEKFLPSGSAVLDLLQKAEGYEWEDHAGDRVFVNIGTNMDFVVDGWYVTDLTADYFEGKYISVICSKYILETYPAQLQSERMIILLD